MKQIVLNIRKQKEFLKSINPFKSYDTLCLNYLIKNLDKISSMSARITTGKRGLIWRDCSDLIISRSEPYCASAQTKIIFTFALRSSMRMRSNGKLLRLAASRMKQRDELSIISHEKKGLSNDAEVIDGVTNATNYFERGFQKV